MAGKAELGRWKVTRNRSEVGECAGGGLGEQNPRVLVGWRRRGWEARLRGRRRVKACEVVRIERVSMAGERFLGKPPSQFESDLAYRFNCGIFFGVGQPPHDVASVPYAIFCLSTVDLDRLLVSVAGKFKVGDTYR